MLQEYLVANRTVWAHEVNLTPAEAREVDAFVRWNAQEENRYYTYDYFRDNCSTRVRDVLDRVLGGQLAAQFQNRPTPFSYRWHTRRLVQGTRWIDQGLSFLLGTRGDLPRSEWEGMFIPMVLMELLEGVELPVQDPVTGEPRIGETRPLLGPRQVVFQATRPPTPSGPPPYSFAWLALGLLAGGGLTGLGRRIASGKGGRLSRLSLAGGILTWSLFSGLLGLLLVSAWFTDHAFIQWNVNLAIFNPLSLPLALVLLPAVLAPRWAGGRVGRLARGGALWVAGLSLLTALLQALGVISQGNLEVLSVALPIQLTLAWIGHSLHRPAPGSKSDRTSDDLPRRPE